jgi:hypothetical protein
MNYPAAERRGILLIKKHNQERILIMINKESHQIEKQIWIVKKEKKKP